MRTTLNVDDDVLLAVQERARREKRTAGQVLSELARQALTPPRRGEETPEQTCTVFGPCRPGEPPCPMRSSTGFERTSPSETGLKIAAGWASCPITENGFVRIISQPRYPNPVSPGEAIDVLSRAREGAHHEFWPCDVSVLDEQIVDRFRLHGPRQVTDAYLLALAVTHAGRFVTFDWSLPPSAVHGATPEHLTVL